jgi:hypothetical protein
VIPGQNRWFSLAPEDIALAKEEGRLTHEEILATGARDRVQHGQAPSLQRSIMSKGSEIAVARFLDRPWTGQKKGHNADVGETIQVRCGEWGLPVQASYDNLDQNFVWTRCCEYALDGQAEDGVEHLSYEIVGWLPARVVVESGSLWGYPLQDGSRAHLIGDRGKMIPLEPGDPRLR